MKLYALTESDRASKGQGGNRFVKTTYTIEHDNKEREEIGHTEIIREHDHVTVRHVNAHGDDTVHNVPIKRI